ncbi:MAG: (2Fe-2S)-binding protein [Pirellulaceae bacterium]
MTLDDDVCICFHVSKRKVVNFLRVQRPRRAGQLADCFGAGTGCGWCRPFLRAMFLQSQSGQTEPTEPYLAEDYRMQRQAYIQAGHGTPPPSVGVSEPVEERPTGD